MNKRQSVAGDVLFRIAPSDNVATALTEIKTGMRVVDTIEAKEWIAQENIPVGHKMALEDICAGEDVVKNAYAIAVATRQIFKGEWVHLHNARSRFDILAGSENSGCSSAQTDYDLIDYR